MVALARHLRVRTAHGLALSQVRGNLPKVVQKGPPAAEILPAVWPLTAGPDGPIPGLARSLWGRLCHSGGLDALYRHPGLHGRAHLGRSSVFSTPQRWV